MTIGRWLRVLGAPLSMFASESALADEPPGCPAGEWVCEEAAPSEPSPAPPQAPPLAPEPVAAPPPVAEVEPADTGAPLPTFDRGWSEPEASAWALALRVEGVMLGEGSSHEDTRLGGVGASLRYTPAPAISLDLGLDAIWGKDYVGRQRSELSLSFSSLIFLNPKDPIRTYVIVGLNASSARVDVAGDEQSWGYFGGHTGLGLEFALGSHAALSIDAVAFMRGRTDSRAAHEPEFSDGWGRVTNTSGGGLLRAGLVLRF